MVELDFGTGLVKVTPAHDLTDFEIGRAPRPGESSRSSISLRPNDRGGRSGPLGEGHGPLRGAAEKIVERLSAGRSHLECASRSYTHNVGHCQRSGVPIEPLVSTQWFLDVSGMARQGSRGQPRWDRSN